MPRAISEEESTRCAIRRGFDSLPQAELVLDRVRRQLIYAGRTRRATQLHTYNCRFCGKLHIGHLKPNGE